MMQRATRLNDEKLGAEAEVFHRILFGRAAPAEVRRQYTAALAAHPISDPLPIEKLIADGVDLEAVELVLRRKNPFNPLTARFRALCYVVEARPEYFDRFIAERRRFVCGALALAFHAARSMVKSIKGGFLLRKYGIG